MKKVIFALSLVSLALVSVSCSTDAYDMPDTEELKVQRMDEQLDLIYDDILPIDDNQSNWAAKDGDEDSANTTDNTGPAVGGTKKD